MEASRGYYCLVQYCPDASRSEAANVGVLLQCPDRGFVGVRTAAGNDRVRRFFGGVALNLQEINAAKRALEHRVQKEGDRFATLEDLQTFIASRGNTLVITDPRPARVTDPVKDLNDLFEELVGGRARQDAELRKREHPRVLEDLFTRLRDQNLGEFDREVPVPLLGRPLVARYAYRNGLLNLVKPKLFPADEHRARSAALRLGAEGSLISRHPELVGGPALVTIVSAGSETSAMSSIDDVVEPLLRDHGVRFVRLTGLGEFAALVEREAHG